ncbi:Hypothetical protein Minf_0817 [Methylacidiphilum infernorum V4]|uniref:Uncharacterized protein n=1 Tax=Methylacidiphilum infernorum (isolate V4) TaxID=481448 RepID=B3E176_METI4|nr:Hypothetical protein Minf_0817 [Methylacidiphilum infernorum V4]
MKTGIKKDSDIRHSGHSFLIQEVYSRYFKS